MLLDLIDTNNLGMYNIKLAQTIGLEAAVYCNQLLTVQSKAQRKQKLVGEFVLLDREYVQRQTTLSIERQLQLDLELIKIGVMTKPEEPNLLLLNVEALGALITNEDLELKCQLKEVLEDPKQAKQQAKEAKQQAIKSKLLASIKCPNVELQVALANWIDAINANPKVPPVNKMLLRKFYDDVNNYTKGEDLDLALWIINTSAAYGWRDAKWAIERFEQSKVTKTVQYKNGMEDSTSAAVY